MRVVILIGKLMVSAMHRHPMGRRVLHGAHAEDRERVLAPQRAGETAMGQEPVVAEVDAKQAEDENSHTK